MKKVIACIIARTTSTRLPLKVLRDNGLGYSMLSTLIRRLKTVDEIDSIYLCTSRESVDDIMEDVAKNEGIEVYRGSPDMVIERMIEVGKISNADILIRVTADNPLSTTELIPDQFNLMINKDLDYVRVVNAPIGATVELIKRTALEDCFESIDPAVSEYMMLYLFDPSKYKCGIVIPFEKDYSDYNLTVDLPDELERFKLTMNHFKQYAENPEKITLNKIMDFYLENESLPALKIAGGGMIKLPYGKSIPFEEFKTDMRNRENQSFKLELY